MRGAVRILFERKSQELLFVVFFADKGEVIFITLHLINVNVIDDSQSIST